MNNDVIKIFLGLLPDCRPAALTCREWYDVYLTIPDSRMWLSAPGDRASYVLPKMYPGVWRGTVFQLAKAGNYEPIFKLLPRLKKCKSSSSVVSLVYIGCARDDIALVLAVSKYTSERALIGAVGSVGSVDMMRAVDPDGINAADFIYMAVIRGNTRILSYFLGTHRDRIIEMAMTGHPSPKTVTFLRDADITGLLVQAVSTPIKSLDLLAEYGYRIPPLTSERVRLLYRRGYYKNILWFSKKSLILGKFADLTEANIHERLLRWYAPHENPFRGMPANELLGLLKRHGADSACVPPIVQTVMERANTKLFSQIMELVTVDHIVKYTKGVCDISWIEDQQLKNTLYEAGFWPCQKARFVRECAKLGCENADPTGVPWDVIRRAYMDLGRWDLL